MAEDYYRALRDGRCVYTGTCRERPAPDKKMCAAHAELSRQKSALYAARRKREREQPDVQVVSLGDECRRCGLHGGHVCIGGIEAYARSGEAGW